ncbi:MAG: hypothetical protein WC799_20160, partial [Desulfobacteraceae bacterium]
MFKKTPAPRTPWHQPQADAERLPHSMFDVGRSMFDVQKKHPHRAHACINPRRTLSGSHIRCSMLDVRCSMFDVQFLLFDVKLQL